MSNAQGRQKAAKQTTQAKLHTGVQQKEAPEKNKMQMPQWLAGGSNKSRKNEKARPVIQHAVHKTASKKNKTQNATRNTARSARNGL